MQFLETCSESKPVSLRSHCSQKQKTYIIHFNIHMLSTFFFTAYLMKVLGWCLGGILYWLKQHALCVFVEMGHIFPYTVWSALWDTWEDGWQGQKTKINSGVKLVKYLFNSSYCILFCIACVKRHITLSMVCVCSEVVDWCHIVTLYCRFMKIFPGKN